jgi:hypothetical protein
MNEMTASAAVVDREPVGGCRKKKRPKRFPSR